MNLTQKQCVWRCTGCSTLRAMETRLPGANSWSAKAPIQFDEVICVFNNLGPCVGMLGSSNVRGVLLLDQHLGLRRIHADGSRHLHWVVYLLLYSPCVAAGRIGRHSDFKNRSLIEFDLLLLYCLSARQCSL
jgi:hypothetical protein